MEIQAIIVWHYYKEGMLVDYSITNFTGSHEELLDCLRNDVSGQRTNKERKNGKKRTILHQVIFM